MYIQLHTKEEQEKIVRALKGPQFDRKRHGSLYDRGSADSYYGRPRDPHWYPQGSYEGDPVEELTAEEREEYLAGYEYNERFGDKKDWR
jgi:hypothetical protein